MFYGFTITLSTRKKITETQKSLIKTEIRNLLVDLSFHLIVRAQYIILCALALAKPKQQISIFLRLNKTNIENDEENIKKNKKMRCNLRSKVRK